MTKRDQEVVSIDDLVDDASQWGDVVGRGKRRARKETVVSVRIPSDVAQRARQVATARGLTLSAWAREILTRCVEPSFVREPTRSYMQRLSVVVSDPEITTS